MVLLYFDKFKFDVREQITGPLLGGLQPLWNAHFRDVQPQLFWFVNLLPWGIGPALMVWGLAGIAWLVTRRQRLTIVAASYPLVHYLVAGQTITPFMRYALPIVPGLAVAAGVFSADLLSHPRWRRLAIAGTLITLVVTGSWAVAYATIYASTDVRLEASRYLMNEVPKLSSILVEPSHNVPPTGHYLRAPSFYKDYVGWGHRTSRTDHFALHTLDVYRHLYSGRLSDGQKREYIAQRLALADYILIDDTFLEFYAHLPESEHGVVKQYYRNLFEGRLGFQLVRTFTRRPSLLGWEINDDPAELTFTLFDHPEIYLFKRIDQNREATAG